MKPISQRRGFSLLDLLFIILAGAIVVIVVLPCFAPRPHHKRLGCSNNLKQVGLAFRIWAGDNNDKFPMQISITNGGAMEWAATGSAYEVFLVMSNELCTPKLLFCPEDWSQNRVIASVFANWNASNASPTVASFPATNTLSYFVGLEADETKPNMILSGDDHFSIAGVKPNHGLLSLATNMPIEWRKERHSKQGNIALADASVQMNSTSALRKLLTNTGNATNRLAMP